jgi:hypothetical protein
MVTTMSFHSYENSNKPTNMKKMLKRIGLTTILIVFLMNLQAQEDDLYEMDL